MARDDPTKEVTPLGDFIIKNRLEPIPHLISQHTINSPVFEEFIEEEGVFYGDPEDYYESYIAPYIQYLAPQEDFDLGKIMPESTALMLAASLGRTEIARILLDAGCDTEVRSFWVYSFTLGI